VTRQETVEKIMSKLGSLDDARLENLLEQLEHEATTDIDAESRVWLDADLAPPLEPYDWGDIDPMTLTSGRVEYVPGEGLMILDSSE
jgi:hypothetical protein